MRPKQKRGLFNFICAFMPGASEMNMGFMKMGASMMATFLGGFMFIAFLNLSDVFIVLPTVLWFYGFFHARNITTCTPDVFMTIKDDYFWNDFIDGRKIDLGSEKARKIIAWALIILGISSMWDLISRPIFNVLDWMISNYTTPYARWIYSAIDSLPRLIVSVLIIFVGLRLINGKKKQLFITDKTFDVASNRSNTGYTAPAAPTAPQGFGSVTSTPAKTEDPVAPTPHLSFGSEEPQGFTPVNAANTTGEEKKDA
jgi:hypothetical protein